MSVRERDVVTNGTRSCGAEHGPHTVALDPVLTPAMTDGMEEGVPNLRKVVIDECGHWTQQVQPEETDRHLLEFLDGLDRWR